MAADLLAAGAQLGGEAALTLLATTTATTALACVGVTTSVGVAASVSVATSVGVTAGVRVVACVRIVATVVTTVVALASGDDLEALANAVREAARPQERAAEAGGARTADPMEVARRGHLRVLRSPDN